MTVTKCDLCEEQLHVCECGLCGLCGEPLHICDCKETASPSPEAGGPKAKKFDNGKPMFHLVPWAALAEVHKVLEFGAEKYGVNNWRSGLDYMRLFNACLRHVFAWLSGQDKDDETGLSHIAHAICCLLFLLTFILEGRDKLDDRPKHELGGYES